MYLDGTKTAETLHEECNYFFLLPHVKLIQSEQGCCSSHNGVSRPVWCFVKKEIIKNEFGESIQLLLTPPYNGLIIIIIIYLLYSSSKWLSDVSNWMR